MNALARLQRWYHSQCNGGWEHSRGVEIGTLENPGWSIQIDLHETPLAGKAFKEHSYGTQTEAQRSGDDWLCCKVQDNVFDGAGGPEKLEEMMEVFLDWAKENS